MTRRQALQRLAALTPLAFLGRTARATMNSHETSSNGPLSTAVLPAGVRSRFVDGINGLRMHVLEAGFEEKKRPGVLLLHGFPELAYSWRRILGPLAEQGYHVMAPDQRGYGRTTGWDGRYDGDLAQFRTFNLVRDALGLVYAMGHRTVAVIGHDWGSPIAAWCGLVRPDVFTSVGLMSAPFRGTGELPFDTADKPPRERSSQYDLDAELARLARPRKHYQRYYKTREANENMWHAKQGLHAFLRGYFHYKSADWEGNKPFRLAARTAEEMAKMPTYYIMDRADGMAETVAKHMPSEEQIASNTWLPERELSVYTEEYSRTGFQGGLNWYRASSLSATEKQLFAGRKLEQPSIYIAGASDWGAYQNPGALESMQTRGCADLRGVHLVPGAGHWVQQEQSETTARLLIEFLET